MAAAGTKNQGILVYIGTKAADGDTDTYVQVKRVKSISRLGGVEAQSIDATALEDAIKQKLKGIPDGGQIETGGNRVYTDPGQNALRAAAFDTDDTPYNVRALVPSVMGGGLSKRFQFKALVLKFDDTPGAVDGLVEFTSTIDITGAITEASV